MAKRTALLLGASGLIGGHCLRELLDDAAYGQVVALARRPLGLKHPKLDERLVDFAGAGAFAGLPRADDVFSCLGTTTRKASSAELYRRIDYDIPLQAARHALSGGAARFLIVSSAGADAASPFFYPRLKGEIDEAVSRMSFEAVHVFRPSLLLGERGESRPAEAALQRMAPLYSWALMGSLRRYRPIHAETVARAMVAAAIGGLRGARTHEFDAIIALAASPVMNP